VCLSLSLNVCEQQQRGRTVIDQFPRAQRTRQRRRRPTNPSPPAPRPPGPRLSPPQPPAQARALRAVDFHRVRRLAAAADGGRRVAVVAARECGPG
jgi:hypothetical protein